MDKNIKTVFQKDTEVPPVVMEKADAAFLAIREEGWNAMKENKGVKTGRFVKSAATAAACAALLVAAGIAGKGMLAGRNKAADAAGENAFTEQDGELAVAAKNVEEAGDFVPAEASGFSLTAYTPEMRLAGTQDGKLAFTDIGCGEGGYTGMLFQVQGDGIADVSVSVDRGELYTTTIDEDAADIYYELAEQGLPDEDGDPDTHTVYQLIGDPAADPAQQDYKPEKVIAYNCAKSGAQVTGAYDGERYYGFYIPDDVVSSKTDLREAYLEELSVFDGAVLTVDITRRDGSSASKEYSLSVAKLALDENRNVTQQEWIEGGEGYVYGILAKEK